MEILFIAAAIAAVKALVPELRYHRVMKKAWDTRQETPSLFLQMAAREPWLRRKWEREQKRQRA